MLTIVLKNSLVPGYYYTFQLSTLAVSVRSPEPQAVKYIRSRENGIGERADIAYGAVAIELGTVERANERALYILFWIKRL